MYPQFVGKSYIFKPIDPFIEINENVNVTLLVEIPLHKSQKRPIQKSDTCLASMPFSFKMVNIWLVVYMRIKFTKKFQASIVDNPALE